MGLVLIAALLVGFALRWWMFEHTGRLRYEPNQRNAFYWGNRIVRAANPNGAAAWGPLWRTYTSLYEQDEAHHASEVNTLDYAPLRLLMAGVWVNYLNIAYGPVSQWRPEFARSFVAFSTIMELAGAAAMFALVARWLKRAGPPQWADPKSHLRGGWEQAAAAAILIWLNPAGIVDSHVWPQGEIWILPFYLLAVLAVVEERFFAAGVALGLGAMFKAQILIVAPALILWPLFDRHWRGTMRIVAGMTFAICAVAWPWLSHGSMAWARTALASHVKFQDVLTKGHSLNLSFVLQHWFHLTLHHRLLNWHILGIRLGLELRSLLIAIYALLLLCCAWGMARQAKRGDRNLLISLAAPWAVMFFVLGQMDERYLVWGACFSAGAVVVGSWALSAHAALSCGAYVMMLEYLMAARPEGYAGTLAVLKEMHPLTGLITAAGVVITLYLAVFRKKDPLQNTEAPGRALNLAAMTTP